MIPLPVGLANFYIFHCHPTQHKDTLWTPGSHVLEITIEKVYLKLLLWSNDSKVGGKGKKGRNMNSQSLAKEWENLAHSLPEQPNLPTLDSKRYHEWITGFTHGANCPQTLFVRHCWKSILTFLNISSSGWSNNTNRDLLANRTALAQTLYPGKTGDLKSNFFMSGLSYCLYLQLFMWYPRSCQVNTWT